MTPEVKAAFDAFPDAPRVVLLQVRAMILASDVAVEEALRWGQPAYLSKKGTTIRLGLTKAGLPSVFTHCQSSVMGDVQAVAGEGLIWDGNRGVSWPVEADVPEAVLSLLIHRALTYHA
ncbi:DUF1801 domain-containing protein [Yoonia sp. R2331]|uniref:DUF1801 domain-containing protein n=1 Tax=Yoonia sp. R2331 TaxID=3237238 RepID=UPI0034E40CED